MLLAIDTSAGTSVAILDSGEGNGSVIIGERSVQDTRRHAEVIGVLISECLSEARVSVERITAVAVGMGPGPFTGLRVGIAAANTFALGRATPIMRIVSHDAVAFTHYSKGGAGPVLVTTDARRNERYWSAYSGVDAFMLPVRMAGPGLADPANLVREVPHFESCHRVDAEWISAVSIGLLAQTLSANDRKMAGNEPLYLRSADVTLPSAPKRVTA